MKTGDIVSSKNWGDALIIKFDNPKSTVRFLNTSNTYEISRVALYNGGFSDPIEKSRLKEEQLRIKQERAEEAPFKKTKYGVGYLGIGPYSHKTHTEYSVLWCSMLRRCYCFKSNHKGYEDCIVCDEWHNFQNFCEDIQKLPGFCEWSKFEKGEGGRSVYQLDKDVLIEGNKVYSQKACQFITHSENTSFAMTGGRVVYIFVKDGELHEVRDLNLWCSEKGYSVGAFRQLLQGNIKSSSGYVVHNPELKLEDHYNPGVFNRNRV